MRAVIFPLILFMLTAGAAAAQDKPLLTVTVRGEEVQYDQEVGTLVVHGKVTVTAATDKPGMPTMSLAAQQVEGNLRTGHLVASEGVKVLSQQLALSGQRADLDFKNDRFTVDQGGMEVDVPSPSSPGRILRGFFFGEKVGFEDRVVYVIEGRITTCDRAHPHYFIGSDKTVLDTVGRTLTIEGGTLELYGLRLHIPGRYRRRLDGGRDSGRPHLPWPGYSSYDGLYTDVTRRFTGAERDWQLTGTVRVGTGFKFPAAFTAERDDGDHTLTATFSRREEVIWDLRERSRLNRLPEVSYVRHLQPESMGLPRLDLGGFVGRVREHPRDLPVVMDALRAGVWFDYTPRPWARQNRRGMWWAASGRQTFYDTGDRLSDLALEAGTGWRWGERLAASLSATHHFTSGDSPFFFDDVWVENELTATVQAPLARHWQLDAMGRYDLDENALRDYTVGVSRRMHCFTWKFDYNFGSKMVQLGLDLNGLTGDTAPPEGSPLVSPDEVPPLPAPVPLNAGEAHPLQIVP